MELTYKQFVSRFFILFGILTAAIMGFIYASDPFVYYHQDGVYKRTFTKNFNMRAQIPGMVRNLEHETIFIGTSMVHNFKEESINEKFNTESFNASISGSSAREQRKTAELAIASQDIKRVFWEVNYDSLAGESNRMDATFPKYLYDRNLLNDLPYLLSYDAIKKIDFQMKNQQNVKMDADPYLYYKFGDNKKPYTIDLMEKDLEGISAPPANSHNVDAYMESFRENMLKMVKEHDDVQFTFFYTPYPVTRHVLIEEKAPQINEDRLKFKLKMFEELKKYKNVAVYDFQDESDITFNMGNYMDRSHYFSYINEWMLDQMAEHEPIQTAKDYEEKVENLQNQWKNFSPDQLKETEYKASK